MERMDMPSYVVVRQKMPYTFKEFHEIENDAVSEAVRLSGKENDTFMVLKVTGVAKQNRETVYVPKGRK